MPAQSKPARLFAALASVLLLEYLYIVFVVFFQAPQFLNLYHQQGIPRGTWPYREYEATVITMQAVDFLITHELLLVAGLFLGLGILLRGAYRRPDRKTSLKTLALALGVLAFLSVFINLALSHPLQMAARPPSKSSLQENPVKGGTTEVRTKAP